MFKTSFGAVILFFRGEINARTAKQTCSCRLLPSCRRSIKRLHSVKPWLARLVTQPFQRDCKIFNATSLQNVQTKSRCHTRLWRCPERTSLAARPPVCLLGARSSHLVVHEVVERRPGNQIACRGYTLSLDNTANNSKNF